MMDSSGNFNFFQDIHMTNSLHRHFHDSYNHLNWTAGTSREVDSVETNQVGNGDVIQSRSRDFRRLLCLPLNKGYDHQIELASSVRATS